MPRTSIDQELEDISEDDFLDSLDAEDYVIVFSNNGELKTLVLPDDYDNEELPDSIQAILKAFGVQKVNQATIH